MTETVLVQGEDKYVQLFKWNARLTRARVNYLIMTEGLYSIRYLGMLNGHKILEETIARRDNPYHIVEAENGYKNA